MHPFGCPKAHFSPLQALSDPKTPSRARWEAKKPQHDPLWAHFRLHLGPSWDTFGPLWGPKREPKQRAHLSSSAGRLLGHSGAILGPFWHHFRTILGPFWDTFLTILVLTRRSRKTTLHKTIWLPETYAFN